MLAQASAMRRDEQSVYLYLYEANILSYVSFGFTSNEDQGSQKEQI